MVGMVLAVMRGTAPDCCIALALDPNRDLLTPMAPELGLFLVSNDHALVFATIPNGMVKTGIMKSPATAFSSLRPKNRLHVDG